MEGDGGYGRHVSGEARVGDVKVNAFLVGQNLASAVACLPVVCRAREQIRVLGDMTLLQYSIISCTISSRFCAEFHFQAV